MSAKVVVYSPRLLSYLSLPVFITQCLPFGSPFFTCIVTLLSPVSDFEVLVHVEGLRNHAANDTEVLKATERVHVSILPANLLIFRPGHL